MSNFPNQGTVYLEGNPVKMVSLLTGNATPQNSPKSINGSEREQIILCDPLTGAPLDLEGGGGGGTPSDATPQAAQVTGVPGTSLAYARGDHAHPLQTALQGGGIPQVSGNYNATTNTVLTGPLTGYQPISSTVPAQSVLAPPAFYVTVAGNPGIDSVGQLNVGDLLYQTGTTWARIAGAQTGWSGLWKGDGNGGFLPATAGADYTPGPLWQTGVSFGVMPSCTVGAAGVITFGTTTPTAFPDGLWMWYSANALNGSSAAGWYWTVLAGTRGSPASGGTVYNNYLASTGNAAQQSGLSSGATLATGYVIPTGLTTAGITGGTHTQPVNTAIFAPGPLMAAGYLGNNGSATFRSMMHNNNSAFAKNFEPFPIGQNAAPTTVTRTPLLATFFNAGRQDRQVMPNLSDFGAFDDPVTTTDTSAAVAFNWRFFFATGSGGNDWTVCDYVQFLVTPRA